MGVMEDTFDLRTAVPHRGGDEMSNELAVNVWRLPDGCRLGRTRFLELLKDGSIPSCLIGRSPR